MVRIAGAFFQRVQICLMISGAPNGSTGSAPTRGTSFTVSGPVRVQACRGGHSPEDLDTGGRFVVLRSGEAYDPRARYPNRKFQFEKLKQV